MSQYNQHPPKLALDLERLIKRESERKAREDAYFRRIAEENGYAAARRALIAERAEASGMTYEARERYDKYGHLSNYLKYHHAKPDNK